MGIIEKAWEEISLPALGIFLFGSFLSYITVSRVSYGRRLKRLGGARAPSLNYSWPFGR
jgi:hypothetical protein